MKTTKEDLALPWRRGQQGNMRIYAADGRDPHSGCIADVLRPGYVEFIVRAVNSHHDLLAALKAIVKGYDGPTVDIGTAVAAAIPAARAAILKAEGQA